jgi:hypothetical protein
MCLDSEFGVVEFPSDFGQCRGISVSSIFQYMTFQL